MAMGRVLDMFDVFVCVCCLSFSFPVCLSGYAYDNLDKYKDSVCNGCIILLLLFKSVLVKCYIVSTLVTYIPVLNILQVDELENEP